MIKGILSGMKVGRRSPPINTMFFEKSNFESCKTLTSILNRYKAASGQCINISKSAITFCSKTNMATKIRVKEELNISSDGGIEKYLGLPEHFARKKRDISAEIVDRIRQRSHGWTARYLSSAGKKGYSKDGFSSDANLYNASSSQNLCAS